MKQPVTFFVEGIPKPAGSKKGFAIKKGGQYTGRVAIVDDCKGGKDWQAVVTRVATEAFEEIPWAMAIKLKLQFIMPRPKGHYRTGRNSHILRDDAPTFHTSKPDSTKLCRAVEDALTGVCWIDDSVIANQNVEKIYGDRPGVLITIAELDQDPGPLL